MCYRHLNDHLHQKIIICTEGNAGFYEAGIMSSALETRYSVLGWNHPGFGYSTVNINIYLCINTTVCHSFNYFLYFILLKQGVPYIQQEQNAAETVMEFVINNLKFHPKEIILYGWSIGGYASSYLAKKYPEVSAIVCMNYFSV